MNRRLFLGLAATYALDLFLPNPSYGKKRNDNLLYTFDDVPFDKGRMVDIVKILKQDSCNSQFYLTGKGISKYPESVEYLIEQGYSVGWHSMNHEVMSRKNRKEFLDDVIEWKILLKEIIPGYEPRFARFPYGLGLDWQIEVLKDKGMVLQRFTRRKRITSNWDVDSIDWNPYFVRTAKDMRTRASKLDSKLSVVLLFHLALAKDLKFGSKVIDESLITSDHENFQRFVRTLKS